MMNCPNCGFVLSEGLPFCVNCGAAVEQTETARAVEALPAASNAPETQTVAPPARTSALPAQTQTSPASPLSSAPPRRSSRAWFFVAGLVALALIATVAGAYMFMSRRPAKRNAPRANVKPNTNRNTNSALPQPGGASNQNSANANAAAQPEGLLRTLAGHAKEITAVAYLPDKKSLASASLDGSVKVWDAETGALKRTFAEPGDQVVALAVAADAATVAVAIGNYGGTGAVLISDVQGGELSTPRQQIKHNNIQTVALTPDGQTLAIGNISGSLTLWDTTNATLKQTLEGQSIQTRAVVFSPDGKWVAAGGYGNTVKLWEAQTGKLRELSGHASEITCVAFAPDGATLASGSYDETVKLWDAADGALRLSLAGGDSIITAVVFTSDGRTLASASNHTIKLWDAATGELRRTFTIPETSVTSLAFAPDGVTLASGCADGKVRVWTIRDE